MTANLTWTPAGGASSTSQDVQYKKASDGSWTTHSNVGPAVATASITGLADDTIYQFRIVNNCSVGGPTPSGQDEDIVFTCPTVTTSNITYNSVDYSFTSVSTGSLTAYEVKLLSSDGSTVLATNTHNTPFATTVSGQFITAINPATSYLIRVIPKAGTYSKTDCATVGFTSGAAPECAAPTNVQATLS